MQESTKSNRVAADELSLGNGELSTLIRDFDWASSSIGPIAAWPQSLKTVVRILLTSRYAMWMGWGPDLTFLYNDSYAQMTLGKKHPWALGRPAHEVWAEIWPDIGPRIRKVLETGEATWDEALLLFLERNGYPEETYHTFSYSPITDDNGKIAGNLCVVTEETKRIIGERRMACLRSLASELAATITEKDVLAGIERSLNGNKKDLPFTLTYLFETGTNRARLACATGIAPGSGGAPVLIELNSVPEVWPFNEIITRKSSLVVDNLQERLRSVPTGEWGKPAERALLVPVSRQGQDAVDGVFVTGLNPYCQLESTYEGFVNLIAGQIAAALANAHAYEEERKRSEALAELDKAKTTFFSNISHEFRTPLTLMLGPTEDALASRDHALRGPDLDTVHRNELRLLKMVNTLLDFSRLEAGRVKASFNLTELAAYTAELASVFRSAMEKAGLSYIVECKTLPEPVYVDREMWEKIVLNLISNALKSTFDGSIAVRLVHRKDHAELVVRDTGTGIPEHEIPHLFERFRRIENAQRRTHEGSGIGLALVHELVNMHGGSIQVESKINKGTSLIVSIPYGKAHLPQDQVSNAKEGSISGSAREAYAQEALSWLPAQEALGDVEYTDLAHLESNLRPVDSKDKPLVLLVDDNRDMREYVQRLLSTKFRVITAANGRGALAQLKAQPPELVLSDVMMPEMDGFQLLEALRSQASTSSIPVILLSARAGEESRIEGMQSGADDYLVKPFTARELLARVDAHVRIARFRRAALAKEAELQSELDTARKRAAEALDQISDTFITLDSEWRFTYANQAALKLVGLRAEELLGENLWTRFPALVGTELEQQYRSSMQFRTRTDFEYPSPVTGRTFRLHCFPAPDGGLLVSGTDITEKRKAEQQLRVKQEHLLLTQRSAKIGSWELDVEDEQLTISPEFAEIAGLPTYVSRLRYSDFLSALFFSEDRKQAEDALRKALRGRKEFSLELRLKRADGEVRLVSSRGKVFYNQGRPVVLGVLIDISQTTTGGLSQRSLEKNRTKKKSRSTRRKRLQSK